MPPLTYLPVFVMHSVWPSNLDLSVMACSSVWDHSAFLSPRFGGGDVTSGYPRDKPELGDGRSDELCDGGVKRGL